MTGQFPKVTRRHLWLQLMSWHRAQGTEPGPGYPGPVELLSGSHIGYAIEHAGLHGYRGLHLSGDDLPLSPFLLPAIAQGRQNGISGITLYSAQTFMSEGLIRKLADARISLKTWFYSEDPVIHNQITGNSVPWDLLVRNIEISLAHGLDLEVTLPMLDCSADLLEETVLFLQDIGVERISLSPDLTPHTLISPKPSDRFLFVHANGDVTFEPGSDGQPAGNLSRTSLEALEDILLPG